MGTPTLSSDLTVFFSLCFVLRFVTPCVGQSHSETLWQLVCNENTDTQCCQQREMPTFSQVPWGTLGKLYLWGQILPWLSQRNGQLDFPTWTKKREKIRTQLKETVRNVIPFNFPVTPPKQTCICNEGNYHKKRFAWLHLTCFSLSFCFVLHDWSHSRVWGLASSILAGGRVQDWFWKK